MYDHVTNKWDKEHPAPLDPGTDKAHDFVGTWGSDEDNRIRMKEI